MNSVVFDFVARQKIGGIDLSQFVVKQLPVLPPETYTQSDIDFIAPRVLELGTCNPSPKTWATAAHPGSGTPDRRAILRAELDVYYAYLYGLTRDELRYVLDPADIHGSDFPSETFRVLKNNETKKYGEYRTQRLVLEAWDQMFEAKTQKTYRQQAA